MNYSHDGMLHDSLRACFQTADVVRLDAALAAAGISEPGVRKAVLDAYFHETAHFLDQGWFQCGDHRYATTVAFERLTPANRRTGDFVLPDPSMGTMFFDFAGGTIDMLFDPDCAESLNVIVGEIEP